MHLRLSLLVFEDNLDLLSAGIAGVHYHTHTTIFIGRLSALFLLSDCKVVRAGLGLLWPELGCFTTFDSQL